MKEILYRIKSKCRKTIGAYKLKKELSHRTEGLIIRNASELNLLMVDRAYLHDDEVPLLAHSAMNAEKTIVEIGCAFGGSSAIFLSHIKKDAELHSIDPFIQDSMAKFQATQEKCRANVAHVLAAAKKQDMLERWNMHPDYSFNVVKTWSKPIDVIFIDGDHTYNAVKKDFDDWYPHVKKGGLIIFHDSRKETGTPEDTFNRGWAGPSKLANELMNDSRVTLANTAYSMTAFKKN